jgi:hypothetical protein
MPRILAATIALGVFLIVGSSAHGGLDPAAVCNEKKAKATGKNAAELLKLVHKKLQNVLSGSAVARRPRRTLDETPRSETTRPAA